MISHASCHLPGTKKIIKSKIPVIVKKSVPASSVSGLNKVRMDLGNLQKSVNKLTVEKNIAMNDVAGLKESVGRLTSESEESKQVLGELQKNVNSLNAQAKNNLPQVLNNLEGT